MEESPSIKAQIRAEAVRVVEYYFVLLGAGVIAAVATGQDLPLSVMRMDMVLVAISLLLVRGTILFFRIRRSRALPRTT